MNEKLVARCLELNSLTDITLVLAYAGELNGEDFEERLKQIAALRREVLAIFVGANHGSD